MASLYRASGEPNRIVHYKLTIDVTESEEYALVTGVIDGIKPVTPGSRSFCISENAEILSMKHGGASAQWSRTSASPVLRQHLDRLVGISVVVDYSIHSTSEPLKIDIAYRLHECGTKRVEKHLNVFLDVYSAWYPLIEPTNKVSFELAVIHPIGFTVRGNGDTTCSNTDECAITTITTPCPQMDMCVCILKGDTHLCATVGSIVGEIRFCNLSRKVAHLLLSEALRIAAFFEQLVERIGPRHITVIVRNGSGSAYSRLGYLVLPIKCAKGVHKNTVQIQAIKLIAHEIAHWWTDVAEPVGRSKWLNEGLAEYFALYYVSENISGRAAFDFLLRAREHLRSLPQALPTACISERDPGYYHQIYTRGAILVWMLASRFKTVSLLKMIDDWRVSQIDYVSDVAAWSTLERALGWKMPIALDEWVCRPGLPHVIVNVDREARYNGAILCRFSVEQPEVAYQLSLQFVLMDRENVFYTDVCLTGSTTSQDVVLPFDPALVIVEPADLCIYTWQSISSVDDHITLIERVNSPKAPEVSVCSLMTFAKACEYISANGSDHDRKMYLNHLLRIVPSHCEWVARWARSQLRSHKLDDHLK